MLDEYIVATTAAKTVDEAFQLYHDAMKKLGFDRVVFSLMNDHKSINRKAGHGIITNYPSEWMGYYVEKDFQNLDPVRAGMFATVGPFIWGEMQGTRRLTKAQLLFMNEAEDAGLHQGVGIPLRGVGGEIAGVGAASSNNAIDLDKVTLAIANMLTTQFYQVFMQLEAQGLKYEPVRLTDREREILQWTAFGKTRSEIAAILKCKEKTVDVHVDNILTKLDTRKMSIALIRALNMSLIQTT